MKEGGLFSRLRCREERAKNQKFRNTKVQPHLRTPLFFNVELHLLLANRPQHIFKMRLEIPVLKGAVTRPTGSLSTPFNPTIATRCSLVHAPRKALQCSRPLSTSTPQCWRRPSHTRSRNSLSGNGRTYSIQRVIPPQFAFAFE